MQTILSGKCGSAAMARSVITLTIAMALTLGFAIALSGQSTTQPSGHPTKSNQTASAAGPSGPAPVHDLTGIWMMHNPPGSNRGFTNYTFTDPKTDPPSLTPWGEEKFKEAKDSNGGAYTLDQTNDPVLTKCYPPGIAARLFPSRIRLSSCKRPNTFSCYMSTITSCAVSIPMAARFPPTRIIALDGYFGGPLGRRHHLVVDTVGFNEKTWLDRLGHAHSTSCTSSSASIGLTE